VQREITFPRLEKVPSSITELARAAATGFVRVLASNSLISPTSRRGGSTPNVFHVDLGTSQRRLHDQEELYICGVVHFAPAALPQLGIKVIR
jgi:hypothetical protein